MPLKTGWAPEDCKKCELDLLEHGFLGLCSHLFTQINALGLILRISDAAVSASSPTELSREIISILIEESPFENASILLFDRETGKLTLAAAKNIHETLGDPAVQAFNRDLSFGPGEGIAWDVHESQVPVFIEDSSITSIPAKKGSVVQPHALACLPLMGRGVLNLSTSKPMPFPPECKRILIIFSNVIAHLISGTDLRERLNASHAYLQQLVEARTEELRRANEEIVASMSQIESIIEHAPQGIAILDSYGNLRYANPGLLRQLGCKMSDLAGFMLERLFCDKADYMALRNAQSNQGCAHLSQVMIHRYSGPPMPAEVFLHNIPAEAGGWILIFHDLTEQKTIAEKMLHTEKLMALGSMASGVAHDFNNLLMSILGNAQLIARETKDPRLIERVRNIELAVQDGAHTVRRLQAFTGLGRETSDHGSTDINIAVNDVMELTRPKWKDDCERKGVTIEFRLSLDAKNPAAIHPSELREVLTNLVFNAVDAMPDGGIILARSMDRKPNVVIEVSDTGTGMPDDVKKRIFDPFFTTKGVGNSGLGLSVSYGLIVKAGGQISVKSREGEGTTFILSLPMAAPEQAGNPVESNKTDQGRFRILVVDDEAQIVELTSTFLEGEGHSVTGSTEPSMAEEILSLTPFDLVITDLGMPGTSGLDVAKTAKKKQPHIKVILMTGWGAEMEGKDLSRDCVDALVSKPFKIDTLLKSINGVMSHLP